MRSIGKRNIELVKKIVRENRNTTKSCVELMVLIPQKLFDIWEGAYSEIENIIWDTIFEDVNV